jgi:hypothetical protein
MRACIIAVFMNSTVSHTQHKGKHYLFANVRLDALRNPRPARVPKSHPRLG